MDVYWLEQSEADVPTGNDWLSSSEVVCLSRLRFAKRRTDWRLGRWTAKSALASYLNASAIPNFLANIELRTSKSGAPEVLFENKLSAISVSFSHRSGIAVCAVAPSGGALGCDLETIEPRSDAFVADYFTTEEQALVAHTCDVDRSRVVTLLWSAKESALKALRVGLRADTRSVIVSPSDTPRAPRDSDCGCRKKSALDGGLPSDLICWRPLQVRQTGGQTFHGWWQHAGNLMCTVVAAPPPSPPIGLAHRPCLSLAIEV
jgi:4'-phosphopantetheinyl transferase